MLNVTTSNNACCEVQLHKRDNKLHYNTDQLKVKQVQGMGLTVAFARDLAKYAPLGLYYLMRVIATGDRASLPLADAWTSQRYLHTRASVEMKTRPFMKMRQTLEREMLCPRDLASKCNSSLPCQPVALQPWSWRQPTLFVPSTFCNLRSPSLIFDWIH